MASLSTTWFCFCSYVTFLRWENWDIGIDTAVYAQTLHAAAQGKEWLFTCFGEKQVHLFSIHLHLLFLPLSWIYRFISNPVMLYILQHAAHALGGLIIGFIAYKTGENDPILGLFAALAFFILPSHARAQVAFDFSFRHLGLFLIPLAALFFQLNICCPAIISLAILTAGSEDLGLTAAFLCFSTAFIKGCSRKLLVLGGVLFILYTLLAIGIIIPHYGGGALLGSHFGYLGEGVLQCSEIILSRSSIEYFFNIFFPLFFIPIIMPNRWFAASIPMLLQNLLSKVDGTRFIGHHYTSCLTALLFLATLEGITRLSRWNKRLVMVLITLLSMVLSIYYFPSLSFLWEGCDKRVEELGANLKILDELIPPAGSLSAPPAVCSHLYKRTGLYFFPHGIDLADWVVVPKYLQGYPDVSQKKLIEIISDMKRNSKMKMVTENPDVFVFSRL